MTTNGNGSATADGAATNGTGPLPARQGPRRHHRRRQLRELASCRASTTTATPIRPSDVPGLMHVDLGGYHVRDIEFTCAFDINATKVGKDLGEAIWAEPNNTIKFTDGARRSSACRSTAA